MRTTTLLALAALVSSTGRTLAQNTPEEINPNAEAPFVRNIRADRPGQTITAQVLQPGRLQLESGLLRSTDPVGGALPSLASATLRIGFFNAMELRVSQPYQLAGAAALTADGRPRPAGFLPVVVGAKLMLSPNFNSRTQVALLVESAVPHTGGTGLEAATLAPAGRLLVSEQLGQRYGLEANFGFSQTGLTVADLERGQFLGTLALNGPLSNRTGFFLEAYGTGRTALTTGGTAGLYWRPVAALRLDVNAGQVLGGPATGSTTLGAGLVLKVGR